MTAAEVVHQRAEPQPGAVHQRRAGDAHRRAAGGGELGDGGRDLVGLVGDGQADGGEAEPREEAA